MLTFNSSSLDCFVGFFKRKENESTKNVAFLNKTHKANRHFVKNCLKKKSDEKENVNQSCEDKKNICFRLEC
jgi:hypothetical protein